MAIKKRMIRNKPFQDDLGIYTYLSDNNSNVYLDSDSVPINADKFIDKDLYSSFVGDSINEAILESKVESSYQRPGAGDELQYLGNSSIKIQSLNIVNRGVNSDINDVYFRFFIFSQAFFNPYKTDGSLESYTNLVTGMQDTEGGAAWFYNQNGPNYSEGGAPGDFQGIKNLTIVENFDTDNYGPVGNTNSAKYDMEWNNKETSFNPIRSLRKVGVEFDDDGNVDGTTGYEDDQTNLFQENGAANLVFFGIHMDGDQDIWPWDRSRNQTINLYAFDPMELFNEDGSGKVTILEWDEPTNVRYSSGDRTAAFGGKEFRMIIDTSGGADLEQGYNPSPKYQNILNEIQYPLYPILTNELEAEIDHVMLNMFPASQIRDAALQHTHNDPEYLGQKYFSKLSDFAPTPIVRLFADSDLQAYYQNDNDRLLVSAPNSVELNFNICLHPLPYRDGLTLYDITQEELTYTNGEEILIDPNNSDGSIPDVNTIIWTGDNYEITYDSIPLEIVSIMGASGDITIVRNETVGEWTQEDGSPMPATSFFNNGGTYTFEISGVQTIYWNQQILNEGVNLSESVELIQKTAWDSYNDEFVNPPHNLEVRTATYNDIITGEQVIVNSMTPQVADYLCFVIDWNDSDDKFKTINDVLADWPRTKQQLLDKRNENLYIPKYINSRHELGFNTYLPRTFGDGGEHLRTRELRNTYNTSGIKTIKSIMVSVGEKPMGDSFPYQNNLEFKDAVIDYVEPLRWKLVTTRIFLDLPSTEFPDFNELGGNDYTTIPWPNTNPVIGGISQDSKYLKSVQDTLSGGKVGNQDIIDETFLINAKENNELGTNIEKLDLEQVRYFNQSYDMNNLLKINPIQDIGGGEFLGIVGIHSDGMFHYTLPSPFTDYNSIPNGYENMNYVLLELGISTYAAAAVFGGNGDPTEGDYQILPQVGTAIDDEGREWKTYDVITVIESVFRPFNDSYYDGETNKYPEESSVGQIFIDDNLDVDLKQNCKIEFNLGNLSTNVIDDSNGNGNKGFLIGDYRIKKNQKNRPMTRDSFIKIPKKTNNRNGAL